MYLCLDETSRVACNFQGKPKLAKCYYFSVAIDPSAKSWQTCGKSSETLKLWNAAISKYIQLIFCFVMKKLLIFNIYIKCGVLMKKEAEHSSVMISGTFLHSTLSYFTQIWAAYHQNTLSDILTDKIVLSCEPKISKKPLLIPYIHVQYSQPDSSSQNLESDGV